MQRLSAEYSRQAAEPSRPAAIEALERLVSLHRGPLLAGFYLRGCPGFERWQLSAQDEVEQLVDSAFATLVRNYQDSQSFDRAIAHARRWVDLDPTNEQAHRALIELYRLTGRRPLAIQQYQSCVRALKEELGVEPEEETTQLYNALRAGTERSDARNHKIAVLPFANLSSDPAQDFLCNGLSDAVRAKLSRLRDLHVLSWASVIRLKSAPKDVRAIGRELGARFILDGGLARHGRDLRISVELIDTVQDRQLWGQTFTGTMDEVFDFQERISRIIAESILPSLSPEEESRIAERPIGDVTAYEAYLRARPGLWSFEGHALREAERETLNALRIVGPNELLYATLARVHARCLESGIDTGPNAPQPDEYVRKAFTLNPESAYGYSVRGQLRFTRGEFQEAIRDLKQAFRIDPNDPETLMFLCYIFMLTGKTQAADPYLRKLLEVDPLTPINHCMPGFLHLMQGDTAEVTPHYEAFYRMDPESPIARLFFGWSLALTQKTETSCSMLAPLAAGQFPDPYVQAARFMKHALEGRKQLALEAAAPPLTAAARQVEFFSRLLVDCYALIDEKQAAMDWLENDVRLGFCNYPYLAGYDPLIETLRRESRFHRLMETVRRNWERFEV
jgi:TolB-like protein/lipoprotein NlpI